jgi:hypothetical protein
VNCISDHEAYLRGRAFDRQDKVNSLSTESSEYMIYESSEELRLQTVQTLQILIYRVIELGSSSILHSYFNDIIQSLQYLLSDPFPPLKILVCEILVLLAKESDFLFGMKYFSVALVRSLLPILRHRHAKVRMNAIIAIHNCMIVPDESKRKAAGSDAIVDLVGFQESNTLQVTTFYKSAVTLNYLAELVMDSSISVRIALVNFLNDLLTTIGDRYDHQTRLLPYILDLLTDENPSVSTVALKCLTTCGQQYELDHPDEIVERRQYGVDGDDRINVDKPLPYPFKERPRIGMRLYTRGNTKRFLNAILYELTNWQAKTRFKSAKLLKMVIVLCEEHLTIEAHILLPAFLKALCFVKGDKDVSLQNELLSVYELFGRYTSPDVYLHYILPRLSGDLDVVQFGVDIEVRESVLELTNSLLSGIKSSQLIPHFEDIIKCITNPYVIDLQIQRLVKTSLVLFQTIMTKLQGENRAITQAYFMNTGRLSSWSIHERTLLQFIFTAMGDSILRDLGFECFILLSQMSSPISETGTGTGIATTMTNSLVYRNQMLKDLYLRHSYTIFLELFENYEIDNGWNTSSPEHRLFLTLTSSPWLSDLLYSNQHNLLSELIEFICDKVSEVIEESLSSQLETEVLISFSNILLKTLIPFTFQSYKYHHASSQNIFNKLTSSDENSNQYQQNQNNNENMLDYLITKLNQATMNISVNSSIKFLLYERVLETFFSNNKWVQNDELLSWRKTILCMLSGISSFLSSKSSSIEFSCPFDSCVISSISSSKFPDHKLFGSLIKFGLKPINSLSTRLTSLELLSSYLKKKYLCRTLQQDNILRASSCITNISCNDEAVSWNRTLKQVMEGLTDASDDVRLAVLHTIQTFVICKLVVYDTCEENNENVEVIESNDGSLVTASNFLIRLLKEMNSCIENKDMIDIIDSSIRVLMVPSVIPKFNSMINSHLQEFQSQEVTEAHDILKEFYSGLLNHADVLMTLSGCRL